MPGRGYLPQVWLLGSSTFSAQLAGLLGLPFSFAFHFAPALVDQAVALYRQHFRPTGLLAEPYVMVAASVLCADSDEEARYLSGPSALAMLHLRTGRPGPVVSPEEAAAYPYTDQERAIVERRRRPSTSSATPTPSSAGLAALVERTGADELMLSTRAHTCAARAHSLTLVAERWGLEARLTPDRPPARALRGPATRGSTSSASRARWSRSARSRIWR